MKIITGIGHCWIEFNNGYELSIFNGMGSYTENHFDFEKSNEIIKTCDTFATWESEEVEIAIIDKQGNFITDKILHNGDKVKGHVSVEELLDIINQLRSEFNG